MAGRHLAVVRDEDGFNLPPLNREDGTSFGWYDRFMIGTTPDGKGITDYSDWEARDLYEMLAKDYKSRQIENVLALPIISAQRSIVPAKGDKGEKEWLEAYWEQDHLNGGSRTPLEHIVDRMTSAFQYKRAYMEKVFRIGTGDFKDKVVYDDLGWRPQTTCRLIRDPRHGNFLGFEQEAYYIGPEIAQPNKWPVQIPAKRAFVYTHGTRRDPLNGTSDMEVAFWAWKTKQKILLLWFQFLQSVALPRIIVKSNDLETARNISKEIAHMKSSGILPVASPGGPESVGIDALDVSGKGAEQFREAIQWLDNAATQSVLAGFLELTSAANEGRGSYALANQGGDFFLQSEEAKAREMEFSIRKDLFAPLIRANFGPTAAVPKYNFEPLNDVDKTTAVSLLQTGMAAPPGSPIPTEFIAALAEQVSTYIGLDGPTMRVAFEESFNAAAAEAKEQAAQAGMNANAQNVAGVAGATNAAKSVVNGGRPASLSKTARAALDAKSGKSRKSSGGPTSGKP